MLDIKFIKEHIELIEENCKKRLVKADVKKTVELYEQKNALQNEMDGLRQKRNENAKKMKQKLSPEERQVLIDEGKELKQQITEMETRQRTLEADYAREIVKIPNLTHETTPIGGEEDSREMRKSGTIREFSFKPKDHVKLGLDLDILDFESGAKVSGQKFYYLKNEGAMLELALINFAMQKLAAKGFTPYLTPDIAKVEVLEGIGFNPRGEETNIYSIAGTEQCLVGTAEITLGGIYSGQIIDSSKLPIKMVGYSHCFRTEAGAAGQATKGLYRVHQFSKVEMFVLCKPEESDAILEDLRSIEEELYTELEIPYRLLDIATGDLGNPAYKKYDLEAWMPGRNEYGEITSTSNCTDYQSRRLGIKYKDDEGKNRHLHMLNGTACAVPRIIISILENFQNEDGTVDIPKALVPFTGFDKIVNK